jgi:hypothetical protein
VPLTFPTIPLVRDCQDDDLVTLDPPVPAAQPWRATRGCRIPPLDRVLNAGLLGRPFVGLPPEIHSRGDVETVSAGGRPPDRDEAQHARRPRLVTAQGSPPGGEGTARLPLGPTSGPATQLASPGSEEPGDGVGSRCSMRSARMASISPWSATPCSSGWPMPAGGRAPTSVARGVRQGRGSHRSHRDRGYQAGWRRGRAYS